MPGEWWPHMVLQVLGLLESWWRTGGRSTGQESHAAWRVGQEVLMFVKGVGQGAWEGSSWGCAAIQCPVLV